MHESGIAQEQVDQIKQGLRNQIDRISSGAGITSEFSSALGQLEQTVDQLRQTEGESYQSVTDNNPARYESQFFEDQLEQSEAYHQKIDFKSLDKVKRNLEKVRNLING